MKPEKQKKGKHEKIIHTLTERKARKLLAESKAKTKQIQSYYPFHKMIGKKRKPKPNH